MRAYSSLQILGCLKSQEIPSKAQRKAIMKNYKLKNVYFIIQPKHYVQTMLDEIFMHAVIMLFIHHPSAMLNNKATEYLAYSIITVTQEEKH